MLYQKLNVLELDKIQKEVLEFIDKNSIIRSDAEEEYFVQMDYSNFPTLYNFVFSRCVAEVVETSSCFLPGNAKLGTHIDGLKKDNGKVPKDRMIASQWVMIIPIANTEETTNYWFKNSDVADDQEIIVNRIRPEPPYDFYVSFADPSLDLEPIGSTTIDKITFIKSDIYHTSVNHSSKDRIVFIVRLNEENKIYETPEELFNYKDLL
jgi:hypothetical protein